MGFAGTGLNHFLSNTFCRTRFDKVISRIRLYIFTLATLSTALALGSPRCAFALDLSSLFASADWNLPATLSESNTAIRYEVDASIHTVRGRVSRLTGRAWLASKDPNSVRVELSFAVLEMNSGNESRDKRMREAMNADKAPQVSIVISEAALPAPASLTDNAPANGELRGDISIAGLTRPVLIPITVTKAAEKYIIKGVTSISWKEFGITDPSTFIATVKDPVKVMFEVTL